MTEPFRQRKNRQQRLGNGEKNISQPVLQIHTHNPHTQLIHYSHPSAMVGSKNTVITHTGAHYEVLRKLLHNVSPMKAMQNSSGLNMHHWVLRQSDVDRYRSGSFLPPSVVMVEFWALTHSPHVMSRVTQRSGSHEAKRGLMQLQVF